MTTTTYNCPIEVTIEAIGGKWKCVILWWLRRDGKRFGELKQLLPGVSSKVLTHQLRELEADGLIQRQTYREAPPRVEYKLTAYGETLVPIADLMCAWGKAHKPEYEFGLLRLDGAKVLLVANDVDEQLRLRAILESRSTEVWLAESVETALAQISRLPDLLVVDIESCGTEGFVLIQQVRSLPTTQSGDIPAVALIRDRADHLQAMRSGFQVHLLKPFESYELAATLSSLFIR
jgi:DNA-binding HxlR family transcriptional regulator/CheY-like chemotaxis protein